MASSIIFSGRSITSLIILDYLGEDWLIVAESILYDIYNGFFGIVDAVAELSLLLARALLRKLAADELDFYVDFILL